MPPKIALMLDGGFVKKKLAGTYRRFPTVADITGLCSSILSRDPVKGLTLLRVYYYDCPPFEGTAVHPLTAQKTDFSRTAQAKQNKGLLDSLELEPDFAVRRGVLLQTGWKLGRNAQRALVKKAKTGIEERDIVPDISQKGVDMRIGLDIATVALKKTADVLILVTGDSDFVPAMKLARKEGMRVYLECLGHPVLRELKVHADLVF